jgi:phage tail-like protein
MAFRPTRFLAFDYLIELTTGSETKALGGFLQVNGLPAPGSMTTPRFTGNPALSSIALRGISTAGDVTLKRGVVDSSQLWSWIDSARTGSSATSRSTAHIILRDQTRQPVTQWTLRSATPKRWNGPALSGKGGGDVAIEELVLSAEGIELVPPK